MYLSLAELPAGFTATGPLIVEEVCSTTVVHPGHDYVGRPVTTIGEEKAKNPLLRERDRERLVVRLSERREPPANMATILRHNLGEADAPVVAPADLHVRLAEPAPPILLDVRTLLEFQSERIEGALSLPLAELDARVDEIPEGAEVVTVCRTGVRATIAAETLARTGRRARVLDGGMVAWRRARLPLRVGRRRLAVDRQVQLIAGSMVLAGVALGTLVSPWFLGLSAFFGAGLTFAGATGTCGLALLLAKLPWNRPLPGEASGGASCAAGSAVAPSCAASTEPRG